MPARTTQVSEENEELYLPDREVDEATDNLSPAVRELMAKYVVFTPLYDGAYPLNFIID